MALTEGSFQSPYSSDSSSQQSFALQRQQRPIDLLSRVLDAMMISLLFLTPLV